MGTAISVLSLVISSLAAALSLAVALRVKKLLDPLTEEGALAGAERRIAPAGTSVPETGALVAINGDLVTLPNAAQGAWIISFQSVGCSGCKVQLPTFVKFLESVNFPQDRVISVISGDQDGMDLYIEQLNSVSTMIASGDGTLPLEAELGITSFPSYLIISEGRVLFSSQSSARLLAEGPALLKASLETTH